MTIHFAKTFPEEGPYCNCVGYDLDTTTHMPDVDCKICLDMIWAKLRHMETNTISNNRIMRELFFRNKPAPLEDLVAYLSKYGYLKLVETTPNEWEAEFEWYTGINQPVQIVANEETFPTAQTALENLVHKFNEALS